MDPQDQHAANLMAGMGVGVLLVGFVVIFAFLAFMVYLLWRIFTKAGMSGALSLLVFIPGFGGLIVLCILAFAEWKVVPVAQYVALPPAYPPPPSYPPAV
jgi:hypothetical protein